MREKRKGEAGVARHAPQAGTKFGFHGVEVVGAKVGESMCLDVPPDEFGGVEIRREPGKRSTTSQCR